jgi:hypothetical protein
MVENQSLHQAAYEHCCRLTVDKIGPACKTVLARAATLISRAVTALEAQEVENAQLWQIPFTESDTLQSARALLGHVEKRITHIGDLKDLSTTASPAHLLDKILTVTATPPTAPAPVATTPTAPTPTMASA